MDVLGLTPVDAIQYVGGAKDLPIEEFKKFCESNRLRKGQAWFNALSREDRDKLVGTWWDPYEADTWIPILAALCYLLDDTIPYLDSYRLGWT